MPGQTFPTFLRTLFLSKTMVHNPLELQPQEEQEGCSSQIGNSHLKWRANHGRQVAAIFQVGWRTGDSEIVPSDSFWWEFHTMWPGKSLKAVQCYKASCRWGNAAGVQKIWADNQRIWKWRPSTRHCMNLAFWEALKLSLCSDLPVQMMKVTITAIASLIVSCVFANANFKLWNLPEKQVT